jgi:hypothetical protein
MRDEVQVDHELGADEQAQTFDRVLKKVIPSRPQENRTARFVPAVIEKHRRHSQQAPLALWIGKSVNERPHISAGGRYVPLPNVWNWEVKRQSNFSSLPVQAATNTSTASRTLRQPLIDATPQTPYLSPRQTAG